jgi:hypothetical protein
MKVVMNFPEIPKAREERLNKLIDDDRFPSLLDNMPTVSVRILRHIMVLDVIIPSILFDVCFSVPPEEIERYQFIRTIQIAKDLDAVVDTVILKVEVVLQTGEMP